MSRWRRHPFFQTEASTLNLPISNVSRTIPLVSARTQSTQHVFFSSNDGGELLETSVSLSEDAATVDSKPKTPSILFTTSTLHQLLPSATSPQISPQILSLSATSTLNRTTTPPTTVIHLSVLTTLAHVIVIVNPKAINPLINPKVQSKCNRIKPATKFDADRYGSPTSTNLLSGYCAVGTSKGFVLIYKFREFSTAENQTMVSVCEIPPPPTMSAVVTVHLTESMATVATMAAMATMATMATMAGGEEKAPSNNNNAPPKVNSKSSSMSPRTNISLSKLSTSDNIPIKLFVCYKPKEDGVSASASASASAASSSSSPSPPPLPPPPPPPPPPPSPRQYAATT